MTQTEARTVALIRSIYGPIEAAPLDLDTTSDSAAACDICRCTLSYILTDYGVQDEIQYWRESQLVAVRDEDSYALDRLCLNVYERSPRAMLLGAAIAVNQAWRLVARRAEAA